MRTRLDEIVEEEMLRGLMPNHGIPFEKQARAVAERAFRHGVEQEFRAPKIFDWYAEGNEMRVRVKSQHAVQPAPAGIVFGENTNTTFYERRRGERRKKAARLSAVCDHKTDGERGIYEMEYINGWYFDRRSGKDRRK